MGERRSIGFCSSQNRLVGKKRAAQGRQELVRFAITDNDFEGGAKVKIESAQQRGNRHGIVLRLPGEGF